MAIYSRVNSIDIAYTEHQYSRFTNSSHYILTVMCVNLAGIQPLFEPHSQALWAFRDWRCFEGYLNRQPAWNPRSLCTKDNQEPKECLRYHGSGWGSYVGRRLEGTGLVQEDSQSPSSTHPCAISTCLNLYPDLGELHAIWFRNWSPCPGQSTVFYSRA